MKISFLLNIIFNKNVDNINTFNEQPLNIVPFKTSDIILLRKIGSWI